MASKSILRVINQSIKYNKLPSEILRIEDEYTSFCFDEACMYISSQLQNEKEPKWNTIYFLKMRLEIEPLILQNN